MHPRLVSKPLKKSLILDIIVPPLLISANGFAFLGALLEPPRLRLWGLHLALSPSGVFAFCSNHQLEITIYIRFQFSVASCVFWVSPVPSSRGRLRAFHFNQQGDFIYLRACEHSSNLVICKSANISFLLISSCGLEQMEETPAGSNGRLRPRSAARRLKHRPAESEAICGKEQRCLTKLINFLYQILNAFSYLHVPKILNVGTGQRTIPNSRCLCTYHSEDVEGIFLPSQAVHNQSFLLIR